MDPAPEIITSKPKFQSKLLIFGLLILLLGGAGGYFLTKSMSLPAPNPSQSAPKKAEEKSAPQNPLIKNQTATVYGKILEKNGNFIKVTNETGQTADIKLAPNILIYKSLPRSSVAEAVTGIDNIDLEKSAVIVLNMFDGEYKVASISYINFP